MRDLINNKDLNGIKQALSTNPALANEGLPYDAVNTVKAHPLHRICDGVFSGTYTDEEGVEMARLFLEYGANVNGNALIEKQDTPLLAASSLHADQVAILYIENGANINHPGCHGGTALHWAAWCGRPTVVKRLIREGAEINKRCIDFESTPLFWAIHGLKSGDNANLPDYVECVSLLMQAGADKMIPNGGGQTVFDLLTEDDWELKEKLNLNETWVGRWNDRYRNDEFAYGEQPNNFLKEQLEKLPIGTILFPAEGEGRNAVFAAKLGWAVSAFDISDEGKNKALRLAEMNQVTIDYQVGELQTLNYKPEQFDVIALIYAHFPADIKSVYHKMLDRYLRKNGLVIFEAFSKNHIDYIAKNEKVGGPKDITMLFSIEELKSDLANYEIIELVEKEIELSEGLFHNGKGSVIRFVGRKR
jgi:hypothetical protein